MKIILLTLTCAALALVAFACTETTVSTTPAPPSAAASPAKAVDEFAASRAAYQKNCEACHGEKGEGGPVKVDNKQIKVPSLKAEHAAKHTDDQLTKMITTGEGPMPAFKDKLNPQQISDMVKFVRKEFQGR